MSNISEFSLTRIVSGIKKKDFTSEEVTRSFINNSKKSKKLNTYITECFDQAIQSAKNFDKKKDYKGLLSGVPIAVKDLFCTRNVKTTAGSKILHNFVPTYESTITSNLWSQGSFLLGKLNCDEFAMGSSNETSFFGNVINPFGQKLVPGGSSGGSAAAVADFMVPLANGTQTGGSVIGPAANCGVYGFKASLDGIDRGGLRHCKPSIDTIGLFARSLEDLVLMYSVQTGRRSVEVTDPLRIGIVRTSDWDETEPCMQKAIQQVGNILGKTGAIISEVELPPVFKEIIPDFSIVNGWEATIALKNEISNYLDSFNPHNRERVEFVSSLTEAKYKNSMKVLSKARVEMDRLFENYDLFLSPALSGEAPVGLKEVRTATFARLWTQMYTPSVCFPIFEGPNGLPVCFQMIGRRNSDEQTLVNAKRVDDQLKGALGAVPFRL